MNPIGSARKGDGSSSSSFTPFKTPLPHSFNQILMTPKTPELNFKYEVVETNDEENPIKVKLIFDGPDLSKNLCHDRKQDSESIPFQLVDNVVSADNPCNEKSEIRDRVDCSNIHGKKENDSGVFCSSTVKKTISSDEHKKALPLCSQPGFSRSLSTAFSKEFANTSHEIAQHKFSVPTSGQKITSLKFGYALPKPSQEMPAPLSTARQNSSSKVNRNVAWTNLKRMMANKKAHPSESSDEEDQQESAASRTGGVKHEPAGLPALAPAKQQYPLNIHHQKIDTARDVAPDNVKPKRTPLATVPQHALVNHRDSRSGSIPLNEHRNEEPNSNKAKQKPAILPVENGRISSADVESRNGASHGIPNTLNNKSSDSNFDRIIINDKSYMVISLLGRGGSSKVYQALEESSKLLRAVKVVNLSEADKASQVAYRKEVEFLLKLKGCTRVIHMFDFEYKETEKELYIVMEKGDHDLVQILRDVASGKESFASRSIKSYWYEMLKAVEEVHEKGIIHSDLKPANFIMAGGKLKLIDFGIASALHSDMTSVVKDTQVGTVNYMSPESLLTTTSVTQPAVIKLRPKSDVWSLGCILYNLTYGHTPFQSIKNLMAKMQAIYNPNFQIPFPTCKDKFLLDVLKKCLQRDPEKRPSIQELLAHPYLTLLSGNVESLVESLRVACSPNTLGKVAQALQPESKEM